MSDNKNKNQGQQPTKPNVQTPRPQANEGTKSANESFGDQHGIDINKSFIHSDPPIKPKK